MGVLAGETVTRQFTLRRLDTGAKSDADSLPTGVLVRNGDDTAVTVTVTNVSTGVYKAAVVIPSSYTAGDEVDLRIAATVNSVSDEDVVWQDSVVDSLVSSGEIDELSDLSGDLPTASQLKSMINRLDIGILNIMTGNGTFGGAEYEENGDAGFRIRSDQTLAQMIAYRKHLMDMLKDPNALGDWEILISQWDSEAL